MVKGKFLKEIFIFTWIIEQWRLKDIYSLKSHRSSWGETLCFRRILVDAGDEGKAEYITNLKQVVQEEDVTIEHIIITHWHHDHIGGVKNILSEVVPGISHSTYFAIKSIFLFTVFISLCDTFSVVDASVWKFPRTDGEEEEGLPLRFLKDGDEFKAGDMILKQVKLFLNGCLWCLSGALL